MLIDNLPLGAYFIREEDLGILYILAEKKTDGFVARPKARITALGIELSDSGAEVEFVPGTGVCWILTAWADAILRSVC